MERREWFQDIDSESRIAVVTDGRPPCQYVVRLEILVGGAWRTIHLFDNAHGRHDEHHYIGDVKQVADEFFFGSPVQALPTAIKLLNARATAIIQRWRQRSNERSGI
jgi:hypothetical protein